MEEIKRISLQLPFNIGLVNCYLIKSKKGYILVDTGGSNQRKTLQEILEREGCKPGNLDLIILTHGDFDHTGNAAYLKRVFDARIAINEYNSGMIEKGDMFWNRKSGNFLIRTIIPLFFGFDSSNRIKPDIYVDERFDLSQYGLQAKIVLLPGHSKGSLGVLMDNGDLICGDLFENIDKVKINSIMDDVETAKASIGKLKDMRVHIIYPGHGNAFPFEMYFENQK